MTAVREQLVVGRLQSLAYLKNLVLYLAQRLRDLVLAVILQLEQNVACDSLMTCSARDICATISPRRPSMSADFPLEVQKPRAPLEPLVDEHGDGRRFFADDFDAP